MPTPTEFNVRLCSARKCLTRVPAPRIFCSRHWLAIPSQIQMDIADAWRRDAEGLTALVNKARNVLDKIERMSTC